jgi:protein-S-isoprenylcysteine O-methyltransferase Ste14
MSRRLRWVLISVLSTFVLFGLSLAAFALGRGNWSLFFQSPARVGALVVSLALSALVVFSDFGGMNPRRFTGLVAIQEGHRLQTVGLYRYIRHPSYTGMLLYLAGYVLVFRCWLGLLLVAGTLAVLVARMNAEEALLESEFGEERPARHQTQQQSDHATDGPSSFSANSRVSRPPHGDCLRRPALVEMIKVDLDRRWQRGQRANLEVYVKTPLGYGWACV